MPRNKIQEVKSSLILTRDLWKEAGRTTQRYIAYPCLGVFPEKTGHKYQIDDCGGEKPSTVGYMQLTTALQKFGLPNLFISESSSLCPNCNERYVPSTYHMIPSITRQYKPEEKYTGQPYLAFACWGIGNLRGSKHSYEICELGPHNELIVLGYASLHKARMRFGAKFLFLSSRSTLCMPCSIQFMARIQELQLLKISSFRGRNLNRIRAS